MTNTPSNLIKTLLILAVAGSMAAFTAQPVAAQTAKKLDCKGCVKSKQIKNGKVKGKDLKDSTVTGSKIAPDAIDSSKIATGAVTLLKLDEAVLPAVTQLTDSGENSDGSISGTPEFLRTLGTFTKVADGTFLKLSWTTNGSINSAPSGTECVYQLRIDGIDDGQGSGLGLIRNRTPNPSIGDHFHVTALFTSVGAGEHDVEAWISGTANGQTCFLNPIVNATSVIIEEFHGTQSPAPLSPVATLGEANGAERDTSIPADELE